MIQVFLSWRRRARTGIRRKQRRRRRRRGVYLLWSSSPAQTLSPAAAAYL